MSLTPLLLGPDPGPPGPCDGGAAGEDEPAHARHHRHPPLLAPRPPQAALQAPLPGRHDAGYFINIFSLSKEIFVLTERA